MLSFKTFISEGGLWDNIHAKRKRIANGSGEHMRKPGSEGAPTAADLKRSAVKEEAELDHDPSEYKRYHKIFHNAWHHGYMNSNGGQTAVNTAANIARAYQSSDKAPRSHRNALEKARKDVVLSKGASMKEEVIGETAAWTRKAGKNPEGGLNRKGIESYRRENPGSKLSMAVTTKPSKLDPDSKAAKRRKSFCARMSGVEGPMKKPNGEPTRKALALRKWNC